MTEEDQPIPPELAAGIEAAEQEIVDAFPSAIVSPLRGSASPAPLPLSDLRERVRILQEASVETYEDGGLRIKFDVEARKALLRPQGSTERW